MKKTLRLILVILFWLSLMWSIAPAQAGFPASRSLERRGEVISPYLQVAIEALQAGEMTTIIVTLRDQADLRQIGAHDRPRRLGLVIAALKTTANQSQRSLRRRLEMLQSAGQVAQITPLWILNGLSVTASTEAIQELAARPDVLSITPDEIDVIPVAPLAYASPEPNLSLINAPALWDMGYLGGGVVVASMDTGVDMTHPDLAGSWRGGTNSWYDPYDQHPTSPTDLSGHGTWTMGVMVGGEAGGTSIGVAPQARWISVKIFNDQGTSTATAIHQGFQWLLDPDGNPDTDDAPHVVNNSWAFSAPGCNPEFQLDLQSLRAAGILPVFAAGNYGPNSSTSVSPANYPEAFAVGAINNINRIYGYSSRGPSACGEAQTVYPDLVAPGVNVRTSDLHGSYYWVTGTSLAAPHVTGALALLLNAFPSLTTAQQEGALKNSAANLGIAGPDNTFGYGRLDLLAAYNTLLNGEPTTTPTVTSPITSPTASPTPTASPSSLPSASPTHTSSPTSAPSPTLGPSPSPSPTPSPSHTPPSPPPSSPTPTPTSTPSSTPTTHSDDSLFADGFEAGNFSAWSAEVDTENDLNISPDAALAGASGMAALIDNKSAMYVQDNSLVSEARYRARFYFDPNSLSMASGDMHTILIARSATLDLVAIDLRFSSGAYQIRGILRTDAGSRTTFWFTISDGSHAIEIDWGAATSAGANNGFFGLWVDGIWVASLTGIDNDTHRLEQARLGPSAGIDTGTSGTEYFDNFVSTRSTYIGP